MGTHGAADFAVVGRNMNATAILNALADAPTELVVTTTVGVEEVPCFEMAGAAYCIGSLIGDPLIGGSTLLVNGNKLVVKGTIAQMK